MKYFGKLAEKYKQSLEEYFIANKSLWLEPEFEELQKVLGPINQEIRED